MKLLFGCDPNAAALKLSLMRTAEKLGHECVDMGSEDPIYANTAFRVAEAVAAGEADRGVLVCGTGLGMTIAANKVKGAYAALLTDVYSAQRAVLSNNANIACLGAFTIGDDSSMRRPSVTSISRIACSRGKGGTLSCSWLSSSAMSVPTMSGRVARNWPSLT